MAAHLNGGAEASRRLWLCEAAARRQGDGQRGGSSSQLAHFQGAMRLLREPAEMARISEQLRARGVRVALVATMGCLHAGHAALVQAAHRYAATCLRGAQGGASQEEPTQVVEVVVSIFTNPAQFNSQADYLAYQVDLEADLELCRRLGAHYVFAPRPEHMYPVGSGSPLDLELISARTCTLAPPSRGALATQLEAASRPGHFAGMLTVVCKLLNLSQAKAAFFGEKDYQQLVLVRAMVLHLNMPVQVFGVATVRDPGDLLPLSSRNSRLTREARRVAPLMYRMLLEARQSLSKLADRSRLELHLSASALLTCATHLTSPEEQSLFRLDYLELRCSRHLARVRYLPEVGRFDCEEAPCARSGANHQLEARLLASVVVGGVRLLDNIEVQLN